MDLMNLFWFLIIGGVAGWLAGIIIKGKGSGILLNIIIGIVGSFIGGWLFEVLDIHTLGSKNTGSLIMASVGAVILLYFVRLIRKR